MNEKQVKLNEFMIAFEKKSPLILISATTMNVTFVKKHPEAHRCLVFSNLHLRWVCIMLHVWSIYIELAWHRLYYINYTRQFCLNTPILIQWLAWSVNCFYPAALKGSGVLSSPERAGGRQGRQAPLTLSRPQFFTDHFQTWQGHLLP